MHQTSSTVPRRSTRDHRAHLAGVHRHAAAAIAIALVAGFAWAAVAAGPASAESVAPEAPRAGAKTTITLSPADFSPTGLVEANGAKQPGNGVTVTVTGEELCVVEPDDAELWRCDEKLLLPNGPGIELTAVETDENGEDTSVGAGTAAIDVLGPPIMDGNGAYLTARIVSGTAYPGSDVTVSAATEPGGAPTVKCSSVPVQNSIWSCNIGLDNGTYYIAAQQSHPDIGSGRLSTYSRPQKVTVDLVAPAAPVITAPRDGANIGGQVSVTGTGENLATVDVYVDNAPACSTTVAGGAWACDIGRLRPGAHSLRAIQRDAVNNYGAPSVPVNVTVGTQPSASPSPSPAPAAPTEPGAPSPAPEPVPSPSEVTPSPSGDEPFLPGTGGQGPPTLTEALTNWGTPTGFGSSLTSLGSRSWFVAPLLGLAFFALIALPLRLLASALRGRISFPRGKLTGRNQVRQITSDADVPKPVNAWLAGAVPLAAASVLVVLATGVNGEVRYVRLLLAVGLGLSILNVVGAAIAIRLGSKAIDLPSRLRFLPLMLLAAALSALVSRWAGLDTPIVAGVLVGAIFAATAPVRQRAMVNLIQVGAVTVMGLIGWIAHGLLGPVDGFWSSVGSETLATLCLAGLGSAAVLVLPIASLPGRVILEWSAPAWIGTVLVVASIVAAVVFAGSGAASATLIPWIAAAAVFAALSIAVWAFVRFVEPQVRA